MATRARPVHCDVAIAGGGLGGLALAAGLAARGYRAHVYEAAKELRTATSTLVGLSPNATTALDGLHPGIVPQIKARGSPRLMYRYIVRTSKEIPKQVVDVPPENLKYIGIRWSEVQQILSEMVPPQLVYCGYKATGYTESDDYVTLHFKGQPDVRAHLVVGADGLRSAIRATMIPDDPGPRYLGHMNWNALLYNPNSSVVRAHEPGELQMWVDVQQPLAPFKHNMAVSDAGGGYTFWQLRIESDKPSFTPDPDAPQLQHSNKDEMITDQQPHIVGGGLGRPGSKARVLALLEEAGFDNTVPLVQATPESAIFERAMLDRVPLDEVHGSMSSPGGRVVLLGDAAHAMHSKAGQGACMAFEDAHQLMVALENHRQQLTGWQFRHQGVDFGTDRSTPTHGSAATDKPHTNGNTGSTHTQESGVLGTSGAACANADQDNSPQQVQQLSMHSPDAVAYVNAAPDDSKQQVEQTNGGDQDAVRAVVAEYEAARLVRTCTVQRYAAGWCGLQAVRDSMAPPGELTKEELQQYHKQFRQWVDQYPDKPSGDPETTFWKPPSQEKSESLVKP